MASLQPEDDYKVNNYVLNIRNITNVVSKLLVIHNNLMTITLKCNLFPTVYASNDYKLFLFGGTDTEPC